MLHEQWYIVSLDCGYAVKQFKGYLLVFFGDTPASALAGGFKEGVGGVYRCCRTCMVKTLELCTQVTSCCNNNIMHGYYCKLRLNVNIFAFVILGSTYTTVH